MFDAKSWGTALAALRGVPRARPGAVAARQGARPHHPVILIPGFVTSSLELWSGPPCAAPYFRSRFWGGVSMTQRVLTQRDCWLQVMALDGETGVDPPPAGNATLPTRLRAVEGLAGVDYFMPGYGVWATMIAELASLGYNAGNLAAETYDWRLGLDHLEPRDGFFTRLAARVETLVATNGGVKAALVAHSWGDTVARTFFAWADTHRSPGWTATHVAHYVNVAGSTLGAAKSVPALLSGETRDTAELGAVAAFLSDNFVSRPQRTRLFRSWGGSLGMLPIGGAAVWGNASGAPDDGAAMALHGAGASFGAFLSIAGGTVLDADAAVDAVLASLSPKRERHARDTWFGPKGGGGGGLWPASKCAQGAHALRCALPSAPDLQVTCLYGVGKPTERGYVYTATSDGDSGATNVSALATAANVSAAADAGALKIDSRFSTPPPGTSPADTVPPLLSSGIPSHPLGGVDGGVRMGDGDGTVNLVSLGALCARGWRAPTLNPSRARVVTREAVHEPLSLLAAGLDPRGGPRSADHVDVLAHEDVLSDVVAIVTGGGGQLEDRYASNVRDVAARMGLW